jgi:hypothetical protein
MIAKVVLLAESVREDADADAAIGADWAAIVLSVMAAPL